jgi:hypothetical protein
MFVWETMNAGGSRKLFALWCVNQVRAEVKYKKAARWQGEGAAIKTSSFGLVTGYRCSNKGPLSLTETLSMAINVAASRNLV